MEKHHIWTPEEDRRLIELIKCGCTQQLAAEKLTQEFPFRFTRDAVKNRLHRIEDNEHVKSEGNIFPDYLYELDEDVATWPDLIKSRNEIHARFKGKKIYCISFSDLHSPLIDFRAVEVIILRHKADIEHHRKLGYEILAVVNGDLYDFPQLSKFEKSVRVDLKKEIDVADELLKVLSELFDHVVVILGNHCYRLFKYINKVSENAPEIKRYMEEKLDPLIWAKEKYRNLLYHKHNKIQIGKTVFTHPFGYNSPILKTVENEAAKVLAHRDRYSDDIQAVIMGHTHQAGSYWLNGVLIMEQGHLTLRPNYNMENEQRRDWTSAYAVVVMDEQGNINKNDTRFMLI